MKKIITASCFIMLVSIAGAQVSAEETLIRKLDQHNATTLVKNDTVALAKYLAKDFLMNTSGNKVSFGGERILSAIRTGRINYLRFDLITDTVYFLNKNTAISMGSETVVSGSEGPLKDQLQKRRYTNIWVKEKKGWQLKARHSSMICADL